MQPEAVPVLLALVGGYTLVAATLDFRTQKIPNYLTIPAAVLGLVYHTFFGSGPLFALAGLAVGFVLLLLPFILGGGGAGDVKMLAALGAWVGPLWVTIILAIGAVLGCVATVAVLTYASLTLGMGAAKRQYNVAGAGVADGRPRKLRRAMPFVVPIAVSTWLVLGFWLMKSMN